MIGKDCVTCCRPPAGRIRKFSHGRIRKFSHGSRCRIEYPLDGRRPLFTEHCHHRCLPQSVRRVGARVPSHERAKGRRGEFLGEFFKSHPVLLVIRETSKPATVRVGGALEDRRPRDDGAGFDVPPAVIVFQRSESLLQDVVNQLLEKQQAATLARREEIQEKPEGMVLGALQESLLSVLGRWHIDVHPAARLRIPSGHAPSAMSHCLDENQGEPVGVAREGVHGGRVGAKWQIKRVHGSCSARIANLARQADGLIEIAQHFRGSPAADGALGDLRVAMRAAHRQPDGTGHVVAIGDVASCQADRTGRGDHYRAGGYGYLSGHRSFLPAAHVRPVSGKPGRRGAKGSTEVFTARGFVHVGAGNEQARPGGLRVLWGPRQYRHNSKENSNGERRLAAKSDRTKDGMNASVGKVWAERRLEVGHRSSFPLTARRIPPRPVHLTTKAVLRGASI